MSKRARNRNSMKVNAISCDATECLRRKHIVTEERHVRMPRRRRGMSEVCRTA